MTPPTQPEQALEAFAAALGLPPIAALHQHGGHDPDKATFHLIMADGQVVIFDDVGALLRQRRFAQTMAVACGVLPAELEPAAWTDALRLLIPARDVFDHDIDAVAA